MLCAQNLGGTRPEAQEFYNHYFQAFSGLARYLDSVKAEAKRKGYTETLFGRRRYFGDIASPIPFIRASAERMAINAPIQGTEADIVKLAMVKIFEYIKKRTSWKTRFTCFCRCMMSLFLKSKMTSWTKSCQKSRK